MGWVAIAVAVAIAAGCTKSEPAPVSPASPTLANDPAPGSGSAPDPTATAVAKATEFKDRMCQCKAGDKACADTAMQEMLQWGEANKEEAAKWDDDEALKAKIGPIGEALMACYKTAAGPDDSDPGPRPAAITDEIVGVAEKVLATIGKLADDLEAAKGDCKKMTAAMQKSNKTLTPLVKQARKYQGTIEQDAAAKVWFDKTFGRKFIPVMARLGGAAAACKDDKAFQAAAKASPLHGEPTP